jgi:hypothetical protein
MPDKLLNAHRNLDDVIESIYAGRVFLNDTERLEHLFKRYKLLAEKEQGLSFTKHPARQRKA